MASRVFRIRLGFEGVLLSAWAVSAEYLSVGRIGQRMAGPLSPEDRRAMRSLAWSTPRLRKCQYIRIVGGGLILVAFAVLAYYALALETGRIAYHSGVPLVLWFAMGVMVAGVTVQGVGTVLRNRALRPLAFRPCPSCGQPNLVVFTHCRSCGAPMGPASPLNSEDDLSV